MRRRATGKVLALHLGVIAVLLVAQFVLPPYHHTNAARIMVLATYAIGYNLLLGYTGLLSLGHAMFFAAGLYGAGLAVHYLELGTLPAFGLGILSSLLLALAFGLVALRPFVLLQRPQRLSRRGRQVPRGSPSLGRTGH